MNQVNESELVPLIYDLEEFARADPELQKHFSALFSETNKNLIFKVTRAISNLNTGYNDASIDLLTKYRLVRRLFDDILRTFGDLHGEPFEEVPPIVSHTTVVECAECGNKHACRGKP